MAEAWVHYCDQERSQENVSIRDQEGSEKTKVSGNKRNQGTSSMRKREPAVSGTQVAREG